MAYDALSDPAENTNVKSQEIAPLHRSATAIDYEGYGLRPSLASFQKNQREGFSFGRVYPRVFSENKNGAEPCAMQADCLFQGHSESPRLKITLGFLQLTTGEIGASEKVIHRLPEEGEFRLQNVPQLEVGGKSFRAWMEAVERRVLIIMNNFNAPGRTSFAFPVHKSREVIQNESGGVAAFIFRRHEILEGTIEVRITRLQNDLFKISARVVNLSSIKPGDIQNPEKVLLRTFASTHFTLEAEGGEFVSLSSTPPEWKSFADDCRNIGCWPVMAGDRKAILASPIISDDCPGIAPESAGHFFDGTEADEMPALHVSSMADALP